MLRPRTREFLKELMVQIFLNSQRSTPLVTSQDTMNVPFTDNRHAVQDIFIKASRIQSLAMGLVYFLSEAFEGDFNADDGYSKFMQWAVGTAKATLQTGIDVVTAL
jgi:nucleolar MIF4G domain-containing protein 1